MQNKFYENLNSKIFKGDTLKHEVFNKLKNIANAFIEFLDIPASAVKDIVLTGSNVSYNYTPQSDLDLHLIVDFEKVHKDCPIVSGFIQAKKSEFNNSHDIYIYGIPVEVYVEPTNASSIYNGLYSIKYNKWLKKPEKLKPLNNSAEIKAKYEEIKNTIDDLLDETKFIKNEVANGEVAEKLMKKLKEMRKAGLHKEGEFSVENQVFKKLRNEGYIGKLVNMRKKGEDRKLSLEEKYEEILSSLEEMLGTSTAVMAPYPTPVAGQIGVHKESKGSSKPAMYRYKYTKSRKSKDSILDSVQEINALCNLILEEQEQTSAQYFGSKYGNYKKREQNNPEYNVSKGNAEREQNLQNKYNSQAVEAIQGIKKIQNSLRNQHIMLAKKLKNGEISKEEARKLMAESGKRIRKNAPGRIYDTTSTKFKNSEKRANTFKKNANNAKNS